MGLTTGAVAKIKGVRNETQVEYGSLHSNVMKDDYWEGEGAAALKGRYEVIKKDIDRQIDKLAGVITAYNNLQRAIDQAESERRKQIEEARIKVSNRYGYSRNM